MGNISGGGYLSGEDMVERNIGEVAIMGLSTNDDESGNVQKISNDALEHEERVELAVMKKLNDQGKCASDESTCSIANVYAPCEVSNQNILWNEIMLEKRRDDNIWFTAGDFNAIRNRSERSGCSFRESKFKAFNQFIENCNLFDMPLAERKFTWFGLRNMRSRLNRVVVKDDWFQKNTEAMLWGLPRTVSYHIPILMGKEMIDWGPRPCKLINSWLDHKSCVEVIKDTLEFDLLHDEYLSAKLRRVKCALQKWNKECYWNVDNEVKKIEKRINELDRKGELDGLYDREREDVADYTRRLWDL
ncbi:uncharacterized protein LOC120126121 [Hibiscus syriacus]|uniref:uncharacterized protein LOC120126121 n=1 Tax=Hibiscus syriacus TaxID=106335 RepID=UPI001922B7AF|nr:uncharacterized protein LOC120126121 [Hibiscus syriacus]